MRSYAHPNARRECSKQLSWPEFRDYVTTHSAAEWGDMLSAPGGSAAADGGGPHHAGASGAPAALEATGPLAALEDAAAAAGAAVVAAAAVGADNVSSAHAHVGAAGDATMHSPIVGGRTELRTAAAAAGAAVHTQTVAP